MPIQAPQSPLATLVRTFLDIEQELDRRIAENAQLKSDLSRLRLENIELRQQIASMKNMD